MSGRLFISRLLLLCSLAGVPLAAAAVTSGTNPPQTARKTRKQDKTAILAMEDVWRDALLHSKADTLEPLIADDFMGIAANGTLSNKEQYLQHLRTGRFNFRTMNVEDQDVRMVGDVAIVSSKARIDASLNGTEYRGTYRYTRVYRRTPGGSWKAINFEATRVSGSSAGDELQRGEPLPKRK